MMRITPTTTVHGGIGVFVGAIIAHWGWRTGAWLWMKVIG